MARKTANFILGLFVILGILIGVVAIIWVGATSYFQKGQTYISYFNESVQGLQMDSAVKYRGVEVGRVEKIRVAPDNKLIGVVMKVNLRGNLPQEVLAQLTAAGITGIMFIDLDRRKPDEPDLSPTLSFPSEYPIIPSRPSEMQRIISGVNAVVQKFDQMDLKGISNQLVATTKAIETFFSGQEMTRILAKVEGTAANLEKISGKVDQVVAAGKLEDLLKEAREALKGARNLVATVQDDLKALKLPETMGKTRAIFQQVEATSENLRQVSENLDKFVERIYDRPPDLLFGKPPQKRWNE